MRVKAEFAFTCSETSTFRADNIIIWYFYIIIAILLGYRKIKTIFECFSTGGADEGRVQGAAGRRGKPVPPVPAGQ